MRESGAAEKKVVLKKIYRMDDLALKRYLLGKLYSGTISGYPKTLGSNEAVKRFVSQIPSALGYIDAASLDNDVRALRIDGRLPGEPGYALAN